MEIRAVVIFLALLRVVCCTSPPDLALALSDMQSNSYYGFAIILRMLNDTLASTLGPQVTFFIPTDQYLANFPVSPGQLEEFILSQAIPGSLGFNDLARLPTGTVFPSLVRNKFVRISGRGKRFVNNAQIVAPNVCSRTTVRCHGIDGVIDHMEKAPEGGAPH